MSESSFGRQVRAAVRLLWTGAGSYFDAWDALYAAIQTGITQAWYEGAKEVGILPNELTTEETVALEQFIVHMTGYIDGFLTAIEEGSRSRGGKLGPLLTRAEIWTNRYAEARNKAKTMAGRDRKLMWVVHPEKEHCETCLKLDGKVKRASQWDAHVRPQDPRLACGGWLCGCELVPTDAPMSRGPLPSIP